MQRNVQTCLPTSKIKKISSFDGFQPGFIMAFWPDFKREHLKWYHSWLKNENWNKRNYINFIMKSNQIKMKWNYRIHPHQHPGDLVLEYMLATGDDDTLLINIFKEEQILATAKWGSRFEFQKCCQHVLTYNIFKI